MTPITLSQAVVRKLKRERAIELLGRKWLLHPANWVKKLPQPLEQWSNRVPRDH